MNNDILEIEVIKTDAGYFLKQKGATDYGNWPTPSPLICLFLDGKQPDSTFNPAWVFVDKLPEKIEREVGQPNLNYRYKLIDKSMKSGKIPAIFKREDVAVYNDSKYQWDWKPEFTHLQSLYELKSDTQPPIKQNVEFSFKTICELDKIVEYSGFSYPVQKTRWESEGYINLTEKDVSHYPIDTILFSGIILPGRTSKLTSKQSYDIVKKHIKDNINPKYAEITSDYDFSFTVCKKIKLTEKESYKVDLNWGQKKSKPKYETRYNDFRKLEIFNMGHSANPWKDTPQIKGFEGKNIQDLKEIIDDYLVGLMEKINEPVVDCKCCKGSGVVIEKAELPK